MTKRPKNNTCDTNPPKGESGKIEAAKDINQAV
jgi:hypothetical protein